MSYGGDEEEDDDANKVKVSKHQGRLAAQVELSAVRLTEKFSAAGTF